MSNYFGKGCKFLSAQWEDERMYTDDSYKENTPVLTFCNNRNNKVPNAEGNCCARNCPLTIETSKNPLE